MLVLSYSQKEAFGVRQIRKLELVIWALLYLTLAVH